MTDKTEVRIPPHGGRLINRVLPREQLAEARGHASRLPVIDLSPRSASDLLLLATGAFSPLEGFMGYDAARSVVERLALPGGSTWSLPVLLQLQPSQADGIRSGTTLALRFRGALVGTQTVEESFRVPLKSWAREMFQTDDPAHPGVAAFLSSGESALAGSVQWLGNQDSLEFDGLWRTPLQTRQEISQRGWSTVAGFQTRNPIHRAHEYVLRTALEITDGLLLHPLVGETRAEDVPANVRLRCYQVLLDNYLPQKRVLFTVLPAWMRYAGPREAVFHAIVRKNFGCTHFLVGRDHAGVGHYYGPYDAHRLLRSLAGNGLQIQPLFFEEVFYCGRCGSMASGRTCAHSPEHRLSLSGTEVRRRLRGGLTLPEEFTRPEVAQVLAEAFGQEGVIP